MDARLRKQLRLRDYVAWRIGGLWGELQRFARRQEQVWLQRAWTWNARMQG